MSSDSAIPTPAAGGGTVDRGELRAALLTRPAAATAVMGLVVAVVAAVFDDRPVAAGVSALVGAGVVLATSAVTGVLGVRTAAARAEAVFAAAMASFAGKVLVFAVALGVVGNVAAARRIPFAVSAIVAVMVWLLVEVVSVTHLRATGAAVFGPSTRRPATTIPATTVPDTTPGTTPGPHRVPAAPSGDDGGQPSVG